jgi:membrane-associated phospholipid phosphatase
VISRRLAPSAFLLVVALLVGLAVRGGTKFDSALSAVLIQACPGWLASAGELIGSLPVFGTIAILAALVALLGSRPRWAAAFVVGLTIEVPTEILKLAVDRPRPPSASEIEAFGSIASYPSGHAARVVILGGLLVACFLWRQRRGRWVGAAAAGVVAGLVAFARIGLGAHWPTDVIGGILVGVAWLELALMVGRSSRPRDRSVAEADRSVLDRTVSSAVRDARNA